MEARLLGSSRLLCTEPESPFLDPALPRLDRLEAGLELAASTGVWSSSLNLAVAVTLVTLAPPLGEELREEPPLEPCNLKIHY